MTKVCLLNLGHHSGTPTQTIMAEVSSVTIKWSGKDYVLTNLSPDDSVADIKMKISAQTGVRPERQKLLGLKSKGTNNTSTF